MSTFVTVTNVNDEEPSVQVIEFSSPEAAEEFVAKIDGMYDSRADARIDAEIVKPEFLIDDAIDSWIDDNLEGFSKASAQGSGAQKTGAITLTVTDYIRTQTSQMLAAIARHQPGGWEATRGVNYKDLPEDVKVLGRQFRTVHGQKVALMILGIHGLEPVEMEAEAALDFTGEKDTTVIVPDFSEYSETDLINFFDVLYDLDIITPELHDEIMSELQNG